MRRDSEYQLSWQIAYYLRAQYPGIIFHYDLTGVNLSKAQAGKMKAIQGLRGYPDLFIAESRGQYKGLYIELKIEGTKLYKCSDNSKYATPHIEEQFECLKSLIIKGYYAVFGIGFDNTKHIIDNYLTGKK